jgi:hypothetical protein
MALIKGLLLVIFVILLIGAGITVGKRYIPQDKLDTFQAYQNKFSQLQQLQPQFQGLFSQASELVASAQQLGEVLGLNDEIASRSSQIKILDSKQPVQQQAVEKVRYEYCQQVIKDYEIRYSSDVSK